MKRHRRCPWCNGTGRVVLAGLVVTPVGTVVNRWRLCQHPGPLTVRALPGVEFRTTKYRVAKGGKKGKPATAWRTPRPVVR